MNFNILYLYGRQYKIYNITFVMFPRYNINMNNVSGTKYRYDSQYDAHFCNGYRTIHKNMNIFDI